MSLRALVEKIPDSDILREMIGFAAERPGLDPGVEVEALIAAPYGEKSPKRLTQRNGRRERAWQTRAGTVAPRIAKLRDGGDFPGLVERRRFADSWAGPRH